MIYENVLKELSEIKSYLKELDNKMNDIQQDYLDLRINFEDEKTKNKMLNRLLKVFALLGGGIGYFFSHIFKK